MSKWRLFFSRVIDYLLPFALQFLSDIGRLALAAALEACATMEERDDLKGFEKHAAAFDMILNTLKAKGPDIAAAATTSLINGAIEVAVKRINAGMAAGFSAKQAASGL